MAAASKVAVVAGATRGAGRGIARSLGEKGFTVYCTGRSTRAEKRPSGGASFDNSTRPETIEETAELVTRAGGHGIPVRVDHLEEAQVQALFARVEKEQQGGLQVLVNDIWGGDAATQHGVPLWEQDVGPGLAMMENAVHTHIINVRHGVPLLMRHPGSLLVEITDGDAFFYRGSLFYDLVKHTVIRLAFACAQELENRGVTAVALTPGFLRSEAMLQHLGVTAATWREAAKEDPHFLSSETPALVGRAVAALATDEDAARFHGKLLSSWGLASHYGFTDEDGTRPDWGRYFSSEPTLREVHAAYSASHRAFVEMGVTERPRAQK